jgi:hypothetical protein
MWPADDTPVDASDLRNRLRAPLRELSVQRKLMVAFLALVLLMVPVGATGVYSVSEVSDATGG